ncbi:uncharacterized protein [Elaeis guineensis]|uniref:Uncharacterized protein LOC105032725 isoform X1 n=1 Tax=Elaeis guineensis var. tenera TaxID=51953 RepID=A0A6I9QA62_ELAGV|nr:uncharacterized protein LOC105032725 isoform X1 [Elaeis guineensis]
MLVLRPCKHYLQMPPLLNSSSFLRPIPSFYQGKKVKSRKLVVKGCQGEEKKSQKRSFLSLEEAGLVEISGLSTHERFLCRLTISSLNLLRVISEQEGVPIEELNAGRICDWYLKDKLKREQDAESAVLQWDDSDF